MSTEKPVKAAFEIKKGTWQVMTLSETEVEKHLDLQELLSAGTLNAGLSRFNSESWKTFTTRDGLPSNTISAITGNKDGQIFVGTPSGLAVCCLRHLAQRAFCARMRASAAREGPEESRGGGSTQLTSDAGSFL